MIALSHDIFQSKKNVLQKKGKIEGPKMERFFEKGESKKILQAASHLRKRKGNEAISPYLCFIRSFHY